MLQKRISNLPDKIEDRLKWVLIGEQAKKAQIAKTQAIKNVEGLSPAYYAALSDTQDAAEILLYVEASVGEMLAKIPRKYVGSPRVTDNAQLPSLPEGVNKKRSHEAQQLAKNQKTIAQVVAKAREEGEVPVRKQVLREIRLAQPKPDTPPIPCKKYRVVYADPPWSYGDKLVKGYGAVEHHYSPMSIDELCAMPVKNAMAQASVLFLWVTSPLLSECWPVIEAWGFEYKSSFVWDKVKHNFGHYNSVRHELLLICTRGSSLPESKKLHDSVVTLERTKKHSEKPEYFRQLIDKMYPKGKRIELFARTKTKGWEVWGNEV